jgi:hypothetical protein
MFLSSTCFFVFGAKWLRVLGIIHPSRFAAVTFSFFLGEASADSTIPSKLHWQREKKKCWQNKYLPLAAAERKKKVKMAQHA